MKDLIAYLQDTSGLEQTALASCVNDDGSLNTDELLKVLPSARDGVRKKLADMKDEHDREKKKHFDNGHAKGKSETLDPYEDKLRADLGIVEKVRGEDLVKAIKAKASAPPSTVDKDTIEKNEHHLRIVDSLKEKHKNELTEKDNALQTFKDEVAERETFNKVWELAQPILDEANVAWSEDPEVKAFQQQVVKDGMRDGGRHFQLREDGSDVLVLDKEKKVMKDDMGNNLSFKGLVLEVSRKRVGVNKSEERGSAGVKPGNGTDKGAGGYKGVMPKSKAELDALMQNRDIPLADRLAAKKAFEEANKTA